jgi:hypothetical protein
MSSKLLIAAGAAATSVEELPFGVRQLIDTAEEILVITPTLPGRFEWLASATDRAREQQMSDCGPCSVSLKKSGPGRRGR